MAKLNEFNIGDTAVFYAMVDALQKRFTPNKAGYYSVTLSDDTATVDARCWDCELIEKNGIKSGEVYGFECHINSFNNKPQFIIKKIVVPQPGEIDVSKFVKTAPLSKEMLMTGIAEYAKTIDNQVLYNLVIKLLKETKAKFFEYPAAMSMHHNYLYGLAYHTYSMLRLADRLLELYPGMNRNLLIAGTILHDIGKTKELSASRAPIYTDEGNLLGHIVIGIEMVSVAASEEGTLDTEEVKSLLHLIASHHGELEFGSPKEPGMMEAYALHLIDLTDSKMAAITPEVVKTKKGTYTAPITSLNRKTLYVPDIDTFKEE